MKTKKPRTRPRTHSVAPFALAALAALAVLVLSADGRADSDKTSESEQCLYEVTELNTRRLDAVARYSKDEKARKKRQTANKDERKRLMALLKESFDGMDQQDYADLDKSIDSHDLSESMLNRAPNAFLEPIRKDFKPDDATRFVSVATGTTNQMPGVDIACLWAEKGNLDKAENRLQINFQTFAPISNPDKRHSGREIRMTVYGNRFSPAIEATVCLNCAYRGATPGKLDSELAVDFVAREIDSALAKATFADNRSNLEFGPYTQEYRNQLPTCTDAMLEQLVPLVSSKNSQAADGSTKKEAPATASAPYSPSKTQKAGT